MQNITQKITLQKGRWIRRQGPKIYGRQSSAGYNVGKYQRTGSSLQASISASYGLEKAELSTPDRSTKLFFASADSKTTEAMLGL